MLPVQTNKTAEFFNWGNDLPPFLGGEAARKYRTFAPIQINNLHACFYRMHLRPTGLALARLCALLFQRKKA